MSYSDIFLIVGIVCSLAAIGYACFLYFRNKKEELKDEKMEELSSYIHQGAMAFLKREYRIIAVFAILVAILLTVLGFIPAFEGAEGIGYQAAIAFVIGASLSCLAGFIGMKSAAYSNARVAYAAKKDGMNKALKVAFNGGSVLGLSVVGLSLLGLCVVFLIFFKIFQKFTQGTI